MDGDTPYVERLLGIIKYLLAAIDKQTIDIDLKLLRRVSSEYNIDVVDATAENLTIRLAFNESCNKISFINIEDHPAAIEAAERSDRTLMN
jgi:methylglyoxal synthase